MSSLSERRRSSLLSQLGRAQSKISALEEFIRERERQLHTAVTRLERSDSRPVPSSTRRRVGLSHELLQMHSLSSTEELPREREGDASFQPLKEYIQLKINRVLDSDDTANPFILRRLVSREYHIGPEGAVIGSSPDASICVPGEAGVNDSHVAIIWVPADESIKRKNTAAAAAGRRGSKLSRQRNISTDGGADGHFILSDLTKGKGVFYLCPETSHFETILERLDSSSPENDTGGAAVSHLESPDLNSHDTLLTHNTSFAAGQLQFSISPLPTNQLLTIRAFNAAENGDCDILRLIIESSIAAGVTSPHIVVSPSQGSDQNRFSAVSLVTEEGLDVNVEYKPPVYDDELIFSFGSSRRRSSAPFPRVGFTGSPLSLHSAGPGARQGKVTHRLLLHIAIERKDTEMVKFLLEKGANPNLCSGEMHQNALHLAALLNLDDVMVELLRFGGDIDVRDLGHCQPLALTTNYNIRRLLLGTMLLCAASEAGDSEEVERLVGTTYITPNAKGLRHKNALHLACARGHLDIAKFLILNGANVNSKGGSRQRTPLHYASLNNHVDVAKLVLESGANEFARDSFGYTALNLSMGGEMCRLLHKEPLSLCLAVQSGDIHSVKRILADSEGDGGEDDQERLVDQRNYQRHAPLHLACTAGNMAMVQVLVSHGANLNLPGGTDGWTPIFYAAMAGHEGIVEFLLSVGASTEIADNQGKSVQDSVEKAMEESAERLSKLEKSGRLVSVVEAPNLQVQEPAAMMRQESASSCSTESEKTWQSNHYKQLQLVSQLLTSGQERLLRAIQSKNLTEFRELLESSVVDPDTQVDKHCPSSAIVRVCEDGLLEFVQALIKHGARVNIVGTADQIPLFVAARNGRADIVQCLVENGADVKAKTVDTRTTVLHEAASSESLATVEYLLSLNDTDKEVLNSSGNTPFDCSSLLEIRELLATGANCLLIAASSGKDDEIRSLIEQEGVDPSHEFKLGLTALHEACDAGHASSVTVLIELKANVNKQTHVSQLSPLHIASQNNFTDIAELLIHAGAKLDLKNSDGKVPFEVAYTNQMRKVLIEARPVRPPPAPVKQDSGSSDKKCLICMDNVINSIILPCGHQAFCTTCVSNISVCALDRQAIREVFFSFTCVLGNVKPAVDDSAHVTAIKPHCRAGWKATTVEILKGHWDSHDRKHSFLVGVVSKLSSTLGVVDCSSSEVSFPMSVVYSHSQSKYRPAVGDWVQVNIVHDINKESVERVQPLREQLFTGNITSVNDHSGIIDSAIHFTILACVRSYRPRVGDEVRCCCVEYNSKQSWRALLVEPVRKEQRRKYDVPLPNIPLLAGPKKLVIDASQFTDSSIPEQLSHLEHRLHPRYQTTDSYQSKLSSCHIPGQRPVRARLFRLPKRLGMYHVPEDFRKYFKETEGRGCFVDLEPTLDEPLCMENYSTRFTKLLHIEELQREVEIRTYDLQQAEMKKCGPFLSISVPGVSEGRPSLLLGDKVVVCGSGDCEDGRHWEGFIHESVSDFSRTPLRRMHHAVQMCHIVGSSVLFPGFGSTKTPALSTLSTDTHWFNSALNVRQKSAVIRIMNGQCRPSPYVIFGPPGTGKTVTIVEAILQINRLSTSSRILVCAPSNSAADLLAERLILSGHLKTGQLVRLNAAQRCQSTTSALEPYCLSSDSIERAHRFRIVVSMCVTAGMLHSLGLPTGHFSHMFVDEAGQATEPECILPVSLLAGSDSQIILAGDPYQLGPVLSSKVAESKGLGLSYLERIMSRAPYRRNENKFANHGSYDPLRITKLVNSYRSHPVLLALSSNMFYNNELVMQGPEAVTDCMLNWSGLVRKGFPLIFHDVQGSSKQEGISHSWFNPDEALLTEIHTSLERQ